MTSRRKVEAISGVEDLWSRIIRENNSEESESNQSTNSEKFALFVGEKQCGKSKLLQTFLSPNKDDNPKPTVALEYTFARRANKSPNQPKDIAHIWELGGGEFGSELVRVPLLPGRLENTVVVIAVNLAAPNNVLQSAMYWFKQIRTHVKAALDVLHRSDADTAGRIIKAAKSRLPEKHPDNGKTDPLPVSVLLVANKYDEFKDLDTVKQKVVAQVLRFIAHHNGASLMFCSSREKNLRDLFKSHLNALFFDAAPKRVVELSGEKPVVAPIGSDSFEQILKTLPASTSTSDFINDKGSTTAAYDIWAQLLQQFFGEPAPMDLSGTGSGGGGGGLYDPDRIDTGEDDIEGYHEGGGPGQEGGDGNEYPEALVDEMRSQKDEELVRYRKEVERRIKMELASASTADATSSSSSSSSSSAAAAAASSSSSSSSGGTSSSSSGKSSKSKSSSGKEKKKKK